MYRNIISEEVSHRGYNGEDILAYYARPAGNGPFPGVVVLHHMPGWDEWSCEVARKFAHHGYAAAVPYLFHRFGPPEQMDDTIAKVRAGGGVPDAMTIGDAVGAAQFLKAQPNSTGKLGLIGFCSGGRQVVLVASNSKEFSAAVDCWGGRVVAPADTLTPAQPKAPIDMTADLHPPLLGIFGNEDQAPSPDQVNEHEAALKQAGKTYEFHRYDGAGHGFFAADRANYRPVQATDAWGKVWSWYDKYLK
ncbi:MAG: dienelactone hydrolase family protein [Dehalococcoidia bacterium]|nr:dienelactone hydrolase family protein [Dehalococcoidia bacterium]